MARTLQCMHLQGLYLYFLQIICWSCSSTLSSIRRICICFQVTRQCSPSKRLQGKTSNVLARFVLTLSVFWGVSIIWVHCGLGVPDFWNLRTALLCAGRKVTDWDREANSWLTKKNLRCIWKPQRYIWKHERHHMNQKGVAPMKPRDTLG